MSSSSQCVSIQKIDANSAPARASRESVAVTVDDWVAVEEPLEIRLGYATPEGRTATSLSITMRTPGADAELASGFLLSEGIIDSWRQIASIDHSGPAAKDSGNRNIVRVELAPDVSVDMDALQRHFYTTSSCGVCGKSSLDALQVAGVKRLDASVARFSHALLQTLPERLRAEQGAFDKTGGLHAAAAFDSQGEIAVVHEDVGRHNAVDKVVGELLARGSLPASEMGLMVSGRASFELMQKALVAGFPLLAAVSAPSSLAVQLAREFHVTLAGFVRGKTFNIYSAAERIT